MRVDVSHSDANVLEWLARSVRAIADAQQQVRSLESEYSRKLETAKEHLAQVEDQFAREIAGSVYKRDDLIVALAKRLCDVKP